MSVIALLVFVFAAILEVVGDAFVRNGLRAHNIYVLFFGCVLLSAYGITVNQLKLDFSKLLGIYVGVFAVTSVIIGRWVFGDVVPKTTVLGLVLILSGSVVISLGAQ